MSTPRFPPQSLGEGKNFLFFATSAAGGGDSCSTPSLVESGEAQILHFKTLPLLFPWLVDYSLCLPI